MLVDEKNTDYEIKSSDSEYYTELTSVVDIIIKDYLFRNYKKELSDSELSINKFLGFPNNENVFMKTPTLIYDPEKGSYLFTDRFISVSVTYKGYDFEMMFKVYSRIRYGNVMEEIHQVFVTGSSKKSMFTKQLLTETINKAIKNSGFRNKVLKYSIPEEPADFITSLKIVNPPETNVNSLFIPEIKKKQFIKFIRLTENYKKHKTPLRFLLNGVPGTGKTQIINSIITELKGKATILVCNGGGLPINKVFEFCSLFEPCILVIDDLDFLVANRDFGTSDRNTLGNFLQQMDGFLPSHVFMLAATNDKNLVDAAASRPGRFDMIIDIGEIEKEHYLSLIKRETDDVQIISLFDNSTLEKLENKKVSGAFIVNLVKQLRLAKAADEMISKEIFYDYLNLLHTGFYDYNDLSFRKSVGF